MNAPNDEDATTQLDGDVQDAASALRGSADSWKVDDVAKALEGKGWTIAWLGLLEVAV